MDTAHNTNNSRLLLASVSHLLVKVFLSLQFVKPTPWMLHHVLFASFFVIYETWHDEQKPQYWPLEATMFITADNMKVLGTTHNTLNMIGYSYTAAFLRDESGSKHVSNFFFLIRIKRKRFFLTICKVVYNQALSAKHSLNMLYVSPTISPCGNESMINFVKCMLRKLKVLGYSFGIKTGCVCFFSYFTKTTYFPNINKRDSIVRALQFVSSAPTTSMTSLWDGNMAVCGLEKPCHWTESRQEFSITLLG